MLYPKNWPFSPVQETIWGRWLGLPRLPPNDGIPHIKEDAGTFGWWSSLTLCHDEWEIARIHPSLALKLQRNHNPISLRLAFPISVTLLNLPRISVRGQCCALPLQPHGQFFKGCRFEQLDLNLCHPHRAGPRTMVPFKLTSEIFWISCLTFLFGYYSRVLTIVNHY